MRDFVIGLVVGVFAFIFIVFMFLLITVTDAFAESYSEQEMKCLALNVYHEARGESQEGQLAVAHVTLNRVSSSKFPNSICKVVKQGQYKNGKPVLHKCQFSWWCDGASDKVRNQREWKSVKQIVATAVKWYNEGEDMSNGALYYHTSNITTRWSKKFTKTAKIGNHLFFDGVKK